MKTIQSLSIITLLAISAVPNAYSGDKEGNGGGAFVCRNAAGKIITAELVDMYEARNQLGLKIKNLGDMDIDNQLEIIQLKAYKAVDAATAPQNFGKQLSDSLTHIRKIMRLVDNVVLENTNDFQISMFPKVCAGGVYKFEQLASYTPTGDLIVDEDIYNTLSTSNKMALELHEALYLMARQIHGSESSLEARRAVGYLLSTVEPKSIPDSVLSLQPKGGSPNKKWKCATTIFYSSCFRPNSTCKDSDLRPIENYGSTFVEAAAQFRRTTAIDSSYFPACARFTKQFVDRSSQSGEGLYQFHCDEFATPENSCFQQF